MDDFVFFFAPDTVYLQGDDYIPSDVRAQFECKWVGVHPGTKDLLALGFARDGNRAPWELAALNTDVWKAGWTQAPDQKGVGR